MGTISQAEWWLENSGSKKHESICKTKLNGGRLGKDRNLKTHDGQPQKGQLKVCHDPDVCPKDHSVTTEELRNLPELEALSQHRLKESLGQLH